jgi:ABC-2 type transport system ATP-binding protein
LNYKSDKIHSVIIEVEDVKKHFKDTKALDGVSLSVKEGEILGLLGPNGAGKTTLVNVLTTLAQPTSGLATVAGFDVVKNPQEVRELIGLAGQFAAIDENLTGRENLVMVGRLYHLTKKEARKRAEEVLERISLADVADRVAKTYSGGMRRRLDLGASLLYQPKVLFLDEPTTGLDPKTRIDLWELIREMVADGTTLLLTTQYLEEADELADNIVVIDHGKVVAEGTSSQLKRKLGSDRLELELADRSKTVEAEQALRSAKLAGKDITSDQTGTVSFSVKKGVRDLQSSIEVLHAAKIEIAHVNLAQPSLDDVFLELTSGDKNA